MHTDKEVELPPDDYYERISRNFEELAQRLESTSAGPLPDFDVVVIGSGYGGAVAANHLASCHQQGKAVSVCLLERGQEYLPGMFPEREAELADHLRFSGPEAEEAKGRREGLFDIRMGKGINLVLANGLGGGSLINAGVMEIPSPGVFQQDWPGEITGQTMAEYYQRARQALGAGNPLEDNTIEKHPQHQHSALKKFQSLNNFNRDTNKFRPAAITVSMQSGCNSEGVYLNACTLCGDCATGCNHGAKESLDLNLLARAARLGATLYTGASVFTIEQEAGSGLWLIDVSYTNKVLRERQGNYRKLRAGKVILAAGTLGSTEILLRSANERGLPLSKKLGQQFSGNGDSISTAYQQREEVNAVADETIKPEQRRVGPTITGVIDLRESKKTPYIIQELAVPGPLRRLFSELTSTALTLHDLDRTDCSWHRRGQPSPDPFAISTKGISHSAIYAVMAQDNARGVLSLNRQHKGQAAQEGILRIDGTALRQDPLYDQQLEKLQDMATHSKAGGRVIANPLWKLLPPSMGFLVNGQEGPIVSVHPLGGCAMGTHLGTGVVDHLGQVFDATKGGSSVHDGLIVLDGSIMPTALGTNPALTIAALSLRAIEELSQRWGFSCRESSTPPRRQRTVIRENKQPITPKPTEVSLTERLVGDVQLRTQDGHLDTFKAELTLNFSPIPVTTLTRETQPGSSENSDRRLVIPDHPQTGLIASTLHIYTQSQWERLQDSNACDPLSRSQWDQAAELVAPLAGSLELFARDRSWAIPRTLAALCAYLKNRGLRDIYQHYTEPQQDKGPGFAYRIFSALKLASRAGETRLFDYQLRLLDSATSKPGSSLDYQDFVAGARISGKKRIVYNRRANPWQQLMQVKLDQFPGSTSRAKHRIEKKLKQLIGRETSAPVLELDTNYLVGKGIPLLQVSGQQDEPTALAELLSLAAYLARMLISIHLWTFRKPDSVNDDQHRVINRLPDHIEGLPEPIKLTWAIDTIAGKDIPLRLTRYPRNDTSAPPVVLIHGYSAGGTTYTHHSIKPNLAEKLHKAGRDVWVLDMRSSIGWDGNTEHTATLDWPWTFEDIAYTDIPFAIDQVVQISGQDKVDIVAHCMGAAMLSMALLNQGNVETSPSYRRKLGGHKRKDYPQALEKLPQRINRIALSQIGPLMVFSPANVMRAYLMSYLRHYLPSDSFSFNPGLAPTGNDGEQAQTLVSQLLDRLLYSLPYPKQDYDIENPTSPSKRSNFTGTRHRMDALYGRTFSLNQLTPETLEHIDEIFGPLNITTLSQVIHFLRYQALSNYKGMNEFVSIERLRKFWPFPTLHIHGEDNGLADPRTRLRMQSFFHQAGCQLKTIEIQGAGHQDCLIGIKTADVAEGIIEFLSASDSSGENKAAKNNQRLRVTTPWSGPIISDLVAGTIPVRLGANPAVDDPAWLCFVPVCKTDEGTYAVIRDNLCCNKDQYEEFILSSMRMFELPDHNDRWHKVQPAWLEASEQIADGLLALFIYDQHPGTGQLGKTHIASAIAHFLVNKSSNSLSSALVEYCDPPVENALQLVFASCQYPAGILYKNLAFESWRRLASQLDNNKGESRPQLLLLMGDQVYTDPTAGLFDPSSREDIFHHPYQRWLHNKQVRSVLRRLPSYMMLDDHEIQDNWSNCPDSDMQWRIEEGRAAYLRYQRHQPPESDEQLHHHFTFHNFDFFMLDTRTERSPRRASGIDQSEIISNGSSGPDQFGDLQQWLLAHKDNDGKPALVSSASMLLPRHRRSINAENHYTALRSDGWDGYPQSLYRLLAFLADREINNVIFLSGDEHMALLANITITNLNTGTNAQTHSIHSSAIHAPFPFANSKAEGFLLNEDFEFTYPIEEGNNYHCRVETELPPAGDGFTHIAIARKDHHWQVNCHFDRRPEPGRDNLSFIIRSGKSTS